MKDISNIELTPCKVTTKKVTGGAGPQTATVTLQGLLPLLQPLYVLELKLSKDGPGITMSEAIERGYTAKKITMPSQKNIAGHEMQESWKQ